VISFGRTPGEWKSKQQMTSLLPILCENEKWRKITQQKIYIETSFMCLHEYIAFKKSNLASNQAVKNNIVSFQIKIQKI
jgi:hypothetical protein